MLLQGGSQAFARGIHLTLLRDIVWGGTYATLRNWLPIVLHGNSDTKTAMNIEPSVASFFANMVAGGCGTILSSPLNYARNLRYGHNVARMANSLPEIFGDLKRDVIQYREGNRIIFLLGRLAIGWGTMRVALGMAFSSQLYLACLACF